ncbi:MAG TPA: rhodanese-like domain-containing protein [Chromatiales bacterium]|nr:rhodanese-like domain-containing protein [Chromatiales bacterium]
MKRFIELIAECLPTVEELFPWDVDEKLQAGETPLLLDVREPYEFDAMHIEGSLNVPRGILESACEWDYEETVPELVEARDREVIVICRSGNRSLLAAKTLTMMGYSQAKSLKTGLRGWNDYELPLVDAQGRVVDVDEAEAYFTPRLRPEQLDPKRRGASGAAAS